MKFAEFGKVSDEGFSKLSPNRSEKVENIERIGKGVVENLAWMLKSRLSAELEVCAGERSYLRFMRLGKPQVRNKWQYYQRFLCAFRGLKNPWSEA